MRDDGRPIPLTLLSAAVLVVAVADLGAHPAHALGSSACEPLSFIAAGEGRVVSYHEMGSSGPGPGDIRPGMRPVTDGSGQVIGQLRWYETLIGPDGDASAESVSVVRYYVMLPAGTLLGEYINLSAEARTDVTRPPIGDDDVIILGGTGAYAGARGTMRQTVRTGGDPLDVSYTVDFVC